MKRIISLAAFTLILSACGSEQTKTEQLIELKKQRAELDKQIADLEKETSKTDSAKATAVAVIELQPTSFNSYVEVQAALEGEQTILATPQAPGVVTKILVREGQQVRSGQTLALLDAAAVEQQIAALNAQVELARQLYEKQQRLWNQNIGTEVQLLQAKTNYEALRKQRQALAAQKNMLSIKSQVNGRVDAIDIKEGTMANPGMNGIMIVGSEGLKATALLGENYLGKVQQGNEVTLIFPDLNDSMRTRLTHVMRSVNPSSRSFEVEARIPANSRLHPNMSARMRISNYTNDKALVVPVYVLQKTSEGDMLYVADGNKARAVIVQTGRTANGMVEITGGLKAGDRVVTAGYEDLDNGELIAIK